MGARERVTGTEEEVLAGALSERHLRKIVKVPSTSWPVEGRLVSVLHAAAVHGPGSMTTLEIARPGTVSRQRVQSSTFVTVVTR